MKPLAIDLFCGLGGWTEGLLAEGFHVIGFDIERHEYGDAKYPAQLVLQDVLTIHGSQFKDAALIVASPPCQEFSYMAMPWSLAKEKQARIRADVAEQKRLTALFDACFSIQAEAIEAAGHHIPLVVENVRGAIPWVGRSRWNYGSFHLWGDVPALMPMNKATKGTKPYPNRGWTQGCAITLGLENYSGQKTEGHPNIRNGHAHTKHLTNPHEHGVKNGGDWFDAAAPSEQRKHASGSTARKAASAMIAKIPLPLSQYIAQVYRP